MNERPTVMNKVFQEINSSSGLFLTVKQNEGLKIIIRVKHYSEVINVANRWQDITHI